MAQRRDRKGVLGALVAVMMVVAIQTAPAEPLDLGVVKLAEGPNTLVVTVVGSNASAPPTRNPPEIIAQRLARRLCDNCKEVRDVPREALEKEGFTPLTLTLPALSLGETLGTTAENNNFFTF